MNAFVETAYAKINLALHVRRRRDDGYHELETLFAFAEDGDRLEARLAGDLTLAIDGPFAGRLSTDADNLVLRAARALRDRFGVTQGASIRLTKRLPVAAGVGGGSADAAAALRLLAKLWTLGDCEADLLAIAAELGADVPACVASVPVRGAGRGDLLESVPNSLAGTPLLLVNPNVPLATGPVFASWDRLDRGTLADGDMLSIARAGRNDLEAPATALVPDIAVVLDALSRRPGAEFVRMSGSGATCFALFADDGSSAAAAAALAEEHPDWWCLATRLR